MKRASMLAAVAGLALAGCQVFAPVVGADDVRPVPMGETCDPIPSCDRLAEPLAPALAVGDIDLTREGCPSGRTARMLTLDRMVSLDGVALRCTDLVVDVASTSTEARSIGLTIDGLALVEASITLRSLGAPVTLRLEVPQLDSVDLTLDGTVQATIARAAVSSTRIHLRSAEPLEAPSLWIDHGTLHDVALDGPRSEVRAVGVGIDRAVLIARSVTLEGGSIQRSHVVSALVETLDADVGASTLEVGHLVATGQAYFGVQLVRCTTAAFFEVHVRGSRIARCDDGVELVRSWIDDSIVESSISGELPTFQTAVLSGERIVAEGGIVGASALCGVQHLDVSRLHCVRCEPSAPPDTCAIDTARTELCPGLCDTTCARTGGPTLAQRETCSP